MPKLHWMAISGLAVLTALLAGLSLALLGQMRVSLLHWAKQAVGRQSVVMAEEMGDLFAAVDAVLENIARETLSETSEISHDWLRLHSVGHPQIGGLAVCRSGKPFGDTALRADIAPHLPHPLCARSKPLAGPGSDAAGDYGLPLATNTNGRHLLTLTRRLPSTNGPPMEAVALIDLHFIEHLFERRIEQGSQIVSLIREDGILVARWPRAPRAVGRQIGRLKGRIPAQQTPTSWIRSSPISGMKNLAVLRKVPYTPFWLLAGQAMAEVDDALYPWSFIVVLAAVVAGVACSAVMVLLLQPWAGWRSMALVHGLRAATAAPGLASGTGTGRDGNPQSVSLLSRLRFLEAVDQALAVGSWQSAPWTTVLGSQQIAIIVVRLEGFAALTADLRVRWSDNIETEIARRLQGTIRQGDIVGLLGGSEFGVVVLDPKVRQNAPAIADRIAGLLTRPFILDQQEIAIQVRIGIAYSPEHGVQTDPLLLAAENAMYEANIQRSPVRIAEIPSAESPQAAPVTALSVPEPVLESRVDASPIAPSAGSPAEPPVETLSIGSDHGDDVGTAPPLEKV